jgi:mRNA-degrading endonuclease RelE of RelBE toxin-antitoxin system
VTAHTLIWQPAAFAGLVGIRSIDPQLAKAVRTAVSALVEDPFPTLSTPLGTSGLRRLRVGDARVLYEIDDTNRAIHILTIGRVRG